MTSGSVDQTTPNKTPELDNNAAQAARERWATRAKPPGSLGTLEDLGVQLAAVTGACPPKVPTRPAVALFAGDHGVVAAGASAWPSEITWAMVATIATRGAAINAFAATIGADVTVVDVGVATPVEVEPASGVHLLDRNVRRGTANLAVEPAMTIEEANAAVEVGRAVVADLVASGADCLVAGEMGIGNTTPSAALIAALCGRSAEEVVGPGAGTPAGGLQHKQDLVAQALRRVGQLDDPIKLLAEIGGLEIAALAGFFESAARLRVPFILDGVIAAAALCVADRLAPGTAARAIGGHRSVEPAATIAMGHLGIEPLLDFSLRLGEGTGAALAVPLVQAAARAMNDMADLPTG